MILTRKYGRRSVTRLLGVALIPLVRAEAGLKACGGACVENWETCFKGKAGGMKPSGLLCALHSWSSNILILNSERRYSQTHLSWASLERREEVK